ncbi:MAG: radical SAM protein [Deltaproteobacteria bacterium]|nr:radical SAM protein [Deltaproteobacteria bacterium]
MPVVLDAIDQAFRCAAAEVRTPPTHFYLNLIETCNLRCRHCITDAPEKTRRGTGRAMSPEVLDAIGPHLRHACYVGLTHAGEPISSPLLEPLLERLAWARDGQPTIVHVLTNGLTLTKDRFASLTSLGVRSWSFSIDGMSSATHDLVRIGSRIDRLTGRIRTLAAVRTASFPGVRMGVAWVMMTANLHEVEALIRFAHEAGLDWVKLEEIYPGNVFARQEGSIDVTRLRDSVARAMDLGQALGVRVLDHTRDVTVWRCRLDDDPQMSAYAHLDDFVNRFEINPCRLPYEVVCIEPNGDVKPVQFERPVAGNLLTQDLLSIWNSPGCRRLRRLARQRRLCGDGPATCARSVEPDAW